MKNIAQDLEKNSQWEAPIELEAPQPMPFDSKWLPIEFSRFVKAVSESIGVAEDMPAVAILSMLSICNQGKYVIEAKKDWQEPLNTYSLIIADPAERKSPTLKLLTQPLLDFEREENDKLRLEIIRSQSEKAMLVKELKSLEEQGSKDLSKRKEALEKAEEVENYHEVKGVRYFVDDVSSERLVGLLSEYNEQMALISSEGGIFETMAGRYSDKANFEVYLKSYNSEILRVDRMGRESEYLKKPHLTMLLMAQPTVLSQVIKNTQFRGKGLIGRFQYCFTSSLVGKTGFYTDPIPKHISEEYQRAIFKLLQVAKQEEPGIIKLSADAREMFANYYEEINYRIISDLSHIQDWAGKLCGTTLRIAGNLHCAVSLKPTEDLVSTETMVNAINISRYFAEHARTVFNMAGVDTQTEDCRYIIKQLKKLEKEEISSRNIFRECRGRFKKISDMSNAIEMLQEYGYLEEKECEEVQRVGRPQGTVYLINPNIYTQKNKEKVEKIKIVEEVFFNEGEMVL